MSLMINEQDNYVEKFLNNKEFGFSILELLIAMVIGLFLLGGITNIYLSSKKTSLERDEYSFLEDNGLIALEIMSDVIEHTGYTSNIAAPLTDRFMNTPITSSTCPGIGGNSVLNTSIFPTSATADFPNTATANNADGDSIGIVYLGDSDIFTDCSGGELPVDCQVSPTTLTKTSRIFNAFFVNSTDNVLMCAGSRVNDQIVIAEGVENLQFLYGIDEDGDKSVDRYVTSDNVNGFWNNIVSVQIGILLRASKETKLTSESISYSVLDTAVVSPNDRYHRAVFSTTVNLRNTL